MFFKKIYRAAAQAKLSADALVAELKASLEWSEGVMAALKHVWKERGPELISMPKESLSIGQVSDECPLRGTLMKSLLFRLFPWIGSLVLP